MAQTSPRRGLLIAGAVGLVLLVGAVAAFWFNHRTPDWESLTPSQRTRRWLTMTPDEKIANLSKRIERYPDHYDLYEIRGDYYTEKGHYDLALADYDREIALQPGRWTAWMGKATTLEKAGRKDEAIEAWRQSLKFEKPGSIEALFAQQRLTALGAPGGPQAPAK